MTLQTLAANRKGPARTETLMGTEYRVLPVRMIKQGVLAANKGPLFYSRSEISKTSHAWNNIPIVIDHPKKGDRFISARTPEVLNQHWIGFVFNAKMVGDALEAEAWIDMKRVQSLDSNLHQRIEHGDSVEVSTGLGTEEVPQQGTYNSRAYVSRAINLTPDHLAVLPYEEGACSIKDGCGLAVNSSSYVPWVRMYERSNSNKPFSLWQITANCGGSCGCDLCGIDFQSTTQKETRRTIRKRNSGRQTNSTQV